MWILSINCCSKRCMKKLSVEGIQKARRNFTLEFLHEHTRISESGEYETEFFVKGKRVCRESWLLAHQMNKETFRRLKKKLKEGVLVSEHGNKGKRAVLTKTSDCVARLQFSVDSVGDYQPEKKSIHLQPCFSKSVIYKILFNIFAPFYFSLNYFFTSSC